MPAKKAATFRWPPNPNNQTKPPLPTPNGTGPDEALSCRGQITQSSRTNACSDAPIYNPVQPFFGHLRQQSTPLTVGRNPHGNPAFTGIIDEQKTSLSLLINEHPLGLMGSLKGMRQRGEPSANRASEPGAVRARSGVKVRLKSPGVTPIFCGDVRPGSR